MDPSDLKCPEVGSLTYRRLCQTLSQPITITEETPRSFTGNRDTDLLILDQMSDRELVNVCAVNKYVNNLCNHPSVWLDRLLKKYGSQLGSGKEIREKYIPPGTSWKDYYLWLSGLLEGYQELVHFIAVENDRKDLMILLGLETPDDSVEIGFKTPVYINDNLRGFLQEGNFGPSDPSNPYSVPLNTYISAINTGIISRVMLTQLLVLYAEVNQIEIPGTKKLKATPLMHKWFGETFRKLSTTRRGFDPNRMRYSDLQRIIHSNTIRRDNLTFFQNKELNNPDINRRLVNESKLYGALLNYDRLHK